MAPIPQSLLISDGALRLLPVFRGPLPVVHGLQPQLQPEPEPVRRLPEGHLLRRRRPPRRVHVPRRDQRSPTQDTLPAQGTC